MHVREHNGDGADDMIGGLGRDDFKEFSPNHSVQKGLPNANISMRYILWNGRAKQGRAAFIT